MTGFCTAQEAGICRSYTRADVQAGHEARGVAALWKRMGCVYVRTSLCFHGTSFPASVCKYFPQRAFNDSEEQLGARGWLGAVSARDFETSWSFLMASSLNDAHKNRSVSSELCFEVLIRSKWEVIEGSDAVCI